MRVIFTVFLNLGWTNLLARFFMEITNLFHQSAILLSLDIARYRDTHLQPGVVLAVQHHVDQGPRPRLLHGVAGHLAQLVPQQGVCGCGLVRVCHGAGCGGNCCRGRSSPDITLDNLISAGLVS